jgi:hypothetical protein
VGAPTVSIIQPDTRVSHFVSVVLKSTWGPQLCPLPRRTLGNLIWLLWHMESTWGPNCVHYPDGHLGISFCFCGTGVDVGVSTVSITLTVIRESYFVSVVLE